VWKKGVSSQNAIAKKAYQRCSSDILQAKEADFLRYLQRSHVVSAKRRRRYDFYTSILFITPLLVLIAAVTIVPILTALRWSLHNTSYANMLEFIGFRNYIDIFSTSRGGDALISILNSLWYVLCSLAIAIPLGIFLAVLLNQELRMRGLLRTAIVLPWVISQTITAMLFRWLYNGNFGVLTYLCEKLFGFRVDFLSNTLTVKFSVVMANVWNSTPVVIILMLAALQSISLDIYEAAKIDGSGRMNTFFRITLPLLKPTIGITLVMQSMEYFNMVTLINNLTGGGPLKATQTLSVYAFRQGFEFWHVGISSAISVIILIFNVLFSLLYIRLMTHDSKLEVM
jgi:multiple sugar transport system permease protein